MSTRSHNYVYGQTVSGPHRRVRALDALPAVLHRPRERRDQPGVPRAVLMLSLGGWGWFSAQFG